MGLGTDRLEATWRTQERPFSTTADERRRPLPRRHKDEGRPTETETEDLAADEDSHQLDDIV
jgi:hypothetical protein